ncbi:MAG: hypothetical protein HYZ37_06260, partial [Candidatus Solibacter usitatus]|nr:hypothetical protein [Candidatus Solibacter usitatus]
MVALVKKCLRCIILFPAQLLSANQYKAEYIRLRAAVAHGDQSFSEGAANLHSGGYACGLFHVRRAQSVIDRSREWDVDGDAVCFDGKLGGYGAAWRNRVAGWYCLARYVGVGLGIWNIPVPVEGPSVQPDTLLVPLLGFDRQGYRLGYGGGYYDRTLAAATDRPLLVGVGFEQALIPTIHP